jgi:nucleoside phosphorylase
LIVVGPVTPNSGLVEMMQPVGSSSTYYCVHEQPSPDDIIVRLLQLKGSLEEDFLICGEYGHFDAFFLKIVSHLQLKETLPELGGNTPSSAKPGKDARQANKKTPAPQSRNTASQSVPIHLPHVQKADILLVTVTEMEEQALLNCFPASEKHTIDEHAYYDFGQIGPAGAVMVRSKDMGPFAVIHCVDEGIERFSPHTVIMVGIAFGLHPNEQEIGDVLVATQIMNCDFQKIRTGPDNQAVILPHGSGISVADRLLKSFQEGQRDWKPPPHIHFGQILSSWRLIDHEGTRDELLRSFPEAIGGEMEGHGLGDVCSHKKVDWILVKAICDWADGKKELNKDDYQRLAAGNAAQFVLSVIEEFMMPLPGGDVR